MEWLLLGSCLIWLLILFRFVPAIFAPRCPFCGAHLTRGDAIEILPIGKHRHLGLRRLICPQCPYYHNRPVIYSDTEVTRYEARTLR
jgi:hypothetical protein